MRTDSFDFLLPNHLIALRPLPQRDLSRLLVLDRSSQTLSHQRQFTDLLAFLRPGDLLVLNNSRVVPARLFGQKRGSGGQIEVLLLEEISANRWWSLLKPGKRVRAGTQLTFHSRTSERTLEAVVTEKNAEGHCCLAFSTGDPVGALLGEFGEIPLPPYLNRPAEAADRERYQTVYAAAEGSVAAPTAGLHFTPELLEGVKALGVEVCTVTLHVGLGTFAPVKAAVTEEHVMHEERFELPPRTAHAINQAKAAGRRVIAVGTTSVRVLESVAAAHGGEVVDVRGRTRIFIYPPFRFQVVDALLTNFHLPRSTLLMLVSAFAAPGETRGRELVLQAYAEAVRAEYRFFSYGDAMLIV